MMELGLVGAVKFDSEKKSKLLTGDYYQLTIGKEIRVEVDLHIIII